MNQLDVGGLRGEEKWRSDRIRAPLGRMGPWGHRREAGEIRRGRREEPSRRSHPGEEGKEQRAFAPPTQAGETVQLPDWSTTLQGPPSLRLH